MRKICVFYPAFGQNTAETQAFRGVENGCNFAKKLLVHKIMKFLLQRRGIFLIKYEIKETKKVYFHFLFINFCTQVPITPIFLENYEISMKIA